MANSGLTPKITKIELITSKPAASEPASENMECRGRMSIRSVTLIFIVVPNFVAIYKAQKTKHRSFKVDTAAKRRKKHKNQISDF
jgi:hypothetical protein